MDSEQSPVWADRRKALDPTIYKVQYYPINIQVEGFQGGVGSGSVTLKNTPFVLDHITHTIVGAVDRDDQDGQYSILWRDDRNTYMRNPVMANAGFGSVYCGPLILLPLRQFFKGSTTFTVDIVNFRNRGSSPFPPWNLQIVFHGFERWDEIRD